MIVLSLVLVVVTGESADTYCRCSPEECIVVGRVVG
jgi:hypothetical protein